MIVEQIWTGNPLRNFNYLVVCSETGEALAVDPLDHEKCLARAKERGWDITQVLNTHEHGDHTGGNGPVIEATGAKLLAHANAAGTIKGVDRGLEAGDVIQVGRREVPARAYVASFNFKGPDQQKKVGALSGGERNRLTLALALALPSNVLVLDEPTNDLDMDTLDMLEDMLADYEGTLIIVSHDRAFLDGVVTSCLNWTAPGKWIETAGGYSDALEQLAGVRTAGKARPDGGERASSPAAKPKPAKPEKLSYKDSYRLKELDTLIPKLTGEIEAAEAALADPDFFSRDAEAFNALSVKLESLRSELEAAEEEWLELEEKREMIEG